MADEQTKTAEDEGTNKKGHLDQVIRIFLKGEDDPIQRGDRWPDTTVRVPLEDIFADYMLHESAAGRELTRDTLTEEDRQKIMRAYQVTNRKALPAWVDLILEETSVDDDGAEEILGYHLVGFFEKGSPQEKAELALLRFVPNDLVRYADRVVSRPVLEELFSEHSIDLLSKEKVRVLEREVAEKEGAQES